MAKSRIDPRWDDIITRLVADQPDISARKIWSQLKIENENREEPIPTREPSKRTVDDRVNKLREPGNKEMLDMHRRVYFPEVIENGDLPIESAQYVMQLMRHYPTRNKADGSTRPTIRSAKWFYHLSLAAPDSPVHSRTTMATMLALNDVAQERGEAMGPWVNRVVEAWLWFEPWSKPEDFHTNQEISPAIIRTDLYSEYIKTIPEDPHTAHPEAPNEAELREIGITLEQWNTYRSYREKRGSNA